MQDNLRRFKAGVFQALAHPTRIAIVELLRDEKERADEAAAYAMAGIPHFWTLDQEDEFTVVTAHRLDNGRYVEEMKAVPGTVTEFEVAGVPVKFDPADLAP